MPHAIRVWASAAIVRDDRLLLVEYYDSKIGYHFNLPGGGVEPGEGVRDAVRRELREETTLDVTVGPLLLVWEVRHERLNHHIGPHHSIGLVFAGEISGSSQPRLPDEPDTYQTGVVWMWTTAPRWARLWKRSPRMSSTDLVYSMFS